MALKNNKKIIVITLVSGTILFVLGVYYSQKLLTNGLKDFYQDKVEGRINSISTAKGMLIVTLMRQGNKEYIFYQDSSKAFKADFRKIANKGDSLFKKSFSDTITVIDNKGISTRFLLRKP